MVIKQGVLLFLLLHLLFFGILKKFQLNDVEEFFLAHLKDWEDAGLYVIPISAYSPELNIIEILWRKIKYEWLSFGA